MNPRSDVTPPGREAQVQALKEKSNVENPWAVAWASYNKDDQLVAEGYDGEIDPGEHTDTIKHQGGKWVLIAKSTGKVLGTHPTKEAAEAQERAVQASKHADGKRVLRIDRTAPALRPPVRLPNGFVRFDGRIARTGVQLYTNPDGSTRRELRLPEEVFRADSLASFAQMPVTNQHPPGLLSAENARQYVVGATGEEIKRDGDYIASSLMFWDAEAIAAAEAGRSQLSCGYSCTLEHAPGRWDSASQKMTSDAAGEPYDFVQRDVQGNHVALVNEARAGAGASLRLDAAGNAVIAFASTVHPPEKKIMAKIRIGHLHLDATDANAEAIQSAFDAAIAAEKKTLADLAATTDAAAVAAKVLQAKADGLQAKLDAETQKMVECDECEGEGLIEGAQCANCDGKKQVFDSAALRGRDKRVASQARMVARRVALEVEARKHLGQDAKLDHLDATGVRAAVVAKISPSAKLDGKSRDYVRCHYDILVTQSAAQPSAIDLARAAAAAAGQAGGYADEVDYIDAQSKFTARMRNAWKTGK